jgi:hypothetical protein
VSVLPETFDLQAVCSNTRKHRGEIAEAAFLAKATSLGFGVARPWGDSERYDFILDCGRRFWRVQVKSTGCYADARYRVKCAGFSTLYTADEVDFLVAYLVPEDLWYVVPIAACAGRRTLNFYPHAGGKAKLERYREAWCQMACSKDLSDGGQIDLPRPCSEGKCAAPKCPFRG